MTTRAMSELPNHFYIVASEFPGAVLGSGGDITGDRDDAYDAFITCHEDGQPTRALRVDMLNNHPVACVDITDEFLAELAEYDKAHRLEGWA